jgi:hypothetical protein
MQGAHTKRAHEHGAHRKPLRMQRSTRISVLGIVASTTALVGLLLGILAASAVSNAHFVGTPTATRNDDTLTVAGKVAGLGDVDVITVTVAGNVACINPGDHHPKAANKEAFSFSSDVPVQNGKALFSQTVDGSTIDPSCDPPMTLQFSDVTVTVDAADGTHLVFTFSGTF